MKFSIITVCLNSQATIEKAIQSVISQDFADKEYIIVDGGSTDETVNIIKKYDKYISKWISEKDHGIFDAMNKGIGMATGEVIAFLNSDDWYLEGALTAVDRVFRMNDCDCVYCDNKVIDQNGKCIYFDASNSDVEDMYKRMICYHSAVFAQKALFRRKDNFDLKYKIAADYDWILREIKKGAKLVYLHKPVFTFCYGGISSVNELECANEARKISLYHLPANKENYIEDINNRYYAIISRAVNGKWLNNQFHAVINDRNSIVLWGAGFRGEQFLSLLCKANLSVAAVIDKDEEKWGRYINGIRIYEPEFLSGKTVCVIITPDNSVEQIKGEIKQIQGSFIVYSLEEIWECMINNG